MRHPHKCNGYSYNRNQTLTLFFLSVPFFLIEAFTKRVKDIVTCTSNNFTILSHVHTLLLLNVLFDEPHGYKH
jgi:hypothetical protein